MDVVLLSAVLEKYGPLGLAFLAVLFVLWWFITKLFPAMIETIGKRLDNIVQTVNRATNEHESNAVKRHGEVITRLDKIDGKIPEREEKEGTP